MQVISQVKERKNRCWYSNMRKNMWKCSQISLHLGRIVDKLSDHNKTSLPTGMGVYVTQDTWLAKMAY